MTTAMVFRPIFRHILLLCIAATCSLSPLSGQAQLADEKDRPNQLDILKINVSQLAINEVRVLHEIQLQHATSLELGAAYIFPNALWFKQGGTKLLATGWGGYVGIRRYMDRKSYIFQPKFRSYISLVGFARFSHYDNEWLQFGSGIDLNNVYCELISSKIQQYGLVTRFGSQSNVGRVVLDFYAGLGIKYSGQQLTSHAINDSTDICAPIPETKYREIKQSVGEWGVAINGGIQVGVRWNNRERKQRAGMDKPADPDYPETPPQF
jgi:hypothetical protein